MKRFFFTAKMKIKETSTFGAVNLIGEYVLRAAGALAMLLIWKTLAQSGGDMNGMTLQQRIPYTLLTAILHPLLDVRTRACCSRCTSARWAYCSS